MGDHSQRSTSVLSLRFQRSCVLSRSTTSRGKAQGLKASMFTLSLAYEPLTAERSDPSSTRRRRSGKPS